MPRNPFKKKIDPRNCSLIEFAYYRTGSMLRAGKVVAFVMSWDVARRDLGHSPTMAEFIEYWNESTATAYRHLAEFREVFDRCETPDQVLDLIEDQRARTSDRVDLVPVARLSPA